MVEARSGATQLLHLLSTALEVKLDVDCPITLIQLDFHAALDARTRCQRVIPALDMRKIR